MNFECNPYKKAIKVIFVNPLAPSSKLIIVKIMSGNIFGYDQFIDLTLIVYVNEVKAAQAFKMELESCGFSYTHTINISSDMPSVTDGDVFCFVTDFCNPNKIDLNMKWHNQFDSLYLILKLANNFSWNVGAKKPIFMVDGLVGMDILKSFSTNLPHDILYCPTSLTTFAKHVLSDYLNVDYTSINDVFVWASNDEIFHIEVKKPIIINDDIEKSSICNWNVIGSDKRRNYDSTGFSASWLKKEFIEKVSIQMNKNSYSCIYKAAEFAETLKNVWMAHNLDDTQKGVIRNVGVISDGSIGTLKGYAYTLPVTFSGKSRQITNLYEDDIYLKEAIMRINKASELHHYELMKYCKKFLKENVIEKSFVHVQH